MLIPANICNSRRIFAIHLLLIVAERTGRFVTAMIVAPTVPTGHQFIWQIVL